MTKRTLMHVGRTFDGIAYGILIVVAILCHPRVGVTPLGALSNLHVVPVLGMVVATLMLPTPHTASAAWRRTLLRLRVAGITTLGLIPFVSWWLRTTDSLYLMICGSAGIFAAVWYLLELLNVLIAVFRDCRCRRLLLEARIGRILALYLVLIPILAVYVAFAVGMWMFPGVLLSDLYETWMLIPLSVRCLMALPILQLCWLLFRAHRALLEEITEDVTVDADSRSSTSEEANA